MTPAPAEIEAAADFIADRWPAVAAQLRRLAAPIETPDPFKLRRMVLRRVWRQHYPGETRTAAARQMATAWHDWTARGCGAGAPLPGTLEAEFYRLDSVGIGPVSRRTIINDLDPSLD